jgi:hypothetical protein
MKKKLLVAVLATLTTSAFAGGAMDFTIPESTKTVATAANNTAPVAEGHSAISTSPNTSTARTANAVQPVRTIQPQPAAQVAMATKPAASSTVKATHTANTMSTSASGAAAPAALAASSAVAASSTSVDASQVPQNADAVNPFTGKSLNEEDLQRQLEASKSRTALLEEQLKQVTLSADIANVPIKKRAEVAKLELPPTPASAPVVTKPVKVVKKREVKKTSAVEVVAPKMPNVRLDGIVVNQGVASAILDVDGNTSVVANGGSTPFGSLKVLNTTSAMVGGMALHVSEDSTIARVHISDPKPVDPKEKAFSLPTANMPVAASSSSGHPLPPVPVPLPPPTTAATTVAH